ncbi:MAG: Zn-dependent hydrolase [Chloroflexota bacterium]
MDGSDPFRNIPNVQRLANDLSTLATFTDPQQPGFTRRPFTGPYRQARHWLRQQMQAAGLRVGLDAAGNLIAARPGSQALPPILIGSHTDTVTGGGRFDGIIGVLGGLEIVRCLDELGIDLRHPLEVVDFLGEEPTQFGVSTVGSRGMVGALDAGLLGQQDAQGHTLREALAELGGRPDDLAGEARQPGSIAAYLELHIEQGPVLDQKGIALAAVTGIAGIRRFHLTIAGQANHAGTTPMSLRRDALVGAAQFVCDVEGICRAEPGAVGTVGHLMVSPNMPNVVPGRVELIAETRSIDPQTIERVEAGLRRRAEQIAGERNLSLSMNLLTDAPPVQADARLLDITLEACRQTAPAALTLPSGAGHDATQLARIAPIGMIFVPSSAGKSHCPEEWTDMEDIALGVQALARALHETDRIF